MTKQILALNLPPNSNVKDIYNLITPAMEEAIIDSLMSQKKFEPLDLTFFKTINSKSPNMLQHYVNDYNEEFVKNIFRQAKENNEKELVENMVKIKPGFAINFMEETINHQQVSTDEAEDINFLGETN